MKPLTLTYPRLIPVLMKQIRCCLESRFDHRLHGLLLVARGMSSREAARLLGVSPRTIQDWVCRFRKHGLSDLLEKERSGHPRSLEEADLDEIKKIMGQLSPKKCGLSGTRWSGKNLSALIEKHLRKKLGIRQCQRLLQELTDKNTQ
jgi:transposase